MDGGCGAISPGRYLTTSPPRALGFMGSVARMDVLR
jgi:hypothetical protein